MDKKEWKVIDELRNKVQEIIQATVDEEETNVMYNIVRYQL
jgi:hypothetical protein